MLLDRDSMNTRNTYSILLAISCLLYFSYAKQGNFYFPYYLLLGGIEHSIDQPFRNIVTEYGYPFEVHSDVQTEDGYLLTLFRIPYSVKTNNSDVKDKPVVLLVHGLGFSAEDFVALGPEKSLAFILADARYDVWLANARGNIHSRRHIKYNPAWHGKFWDFSFHEIGYYDHKANVDYILTITKQEQLYYFGHSQGGSSFLILNSLRPEYNQRFKLMVALAPAVLMSHSKNLVFRALSLSNTIDHIIYAAGFKELPHFRFYSFLGKHVCKVKGIPQRVCKNVHFSIIGGVSPHFTEELLPKVMQHEYAGFAFKQAVHYGQLVKHKRFCQYDHGRKKNLQIYGTELPTDYNLTNVVVPIAYYYGKHDTACVPKDQEDSIRLLPNVVDNYLLPYNKFTHVDMLVGNDAESLVYQRALKLMQQY